MRWLAHLLYADDTVLVDISGAVVEQYMQCVAAVGTEYGLLLNAQKIELLKVRSQEKVLRPDGSEIDSKDSFDSFIYLGSSNNLFEWIT